MASPDKGSMSEGGAARRAGLALRFAVLALAVVAIAWPSAPPVVSAGLSGSEWRVVEIDGQEASGAGSLRFTLTSVRGKAACNSFMGAFREIGGAIEIAGLGATRMFCDGRMDLERMLLDALAGARSYILEGTHLVLRDGGGRTLVKLAG